jgi:hypothetical protein
MTRQQMIALERHCRLGFETAHPRYRRIDSTSQVSIILTVNSGYE